jgi:UDP-N-acetylmuramoyl-L-alanyl-D-glutamate--2,6-diaminopimelate ligase
MTRWFVDRSPHRGIPSVSLRRLLPEARFVGCQDWEVSGCTADVRKLDPGQLFVAVRGDRVDGHAFVGRALEQGAAGVVVERPCPEAGRLQVVVPDSRAAHARISQALAGDPAARLRVSGVTGRRGKSATAALLGSILRAGGESVGSIGRSGWSDGASDRPTGPGSPGPEGFASMLAAIAGRRCDSAVLEVDDRALDRREVDGVAFQEAVITNLGGEPVGGPDGDALLARRRSFARLARLVEPGGSVVLGVDEPAADLLGAVNLGARRVTFGRDRPAHVWAAVDRVDGSGTRFRLRGFGREAAVTLRLAGEDHLTHALAAAAVAWSRGVAVQAVVDGLEAVTRLPGRLEPIRQGQDFEVRVDRARTAPDLTRALDALRSLGAGRVICVMGAEGGRDRLGRAALGSAAEAGADRVILTTDNPRAEDPDRILDDLLAGFRHPGRVLVEPDRWAAIARALADARPGDAVLIAGKGHHTYQILADRVLPFDDAEVAARWLRARRVARGSASA